MRMISLAFILFLTPALASAQDAPQLIASPPGAAPQGEMCVPALNECRGALGAVRSDLDVCVDELAQCSGLSKDSVRNAIKERKPIKKAKKTAVKKPSPASQPAKPKAKKVEAPKPVLVKGPAGPQGPAGPAGQRGLPGRDGRDGHDGRDGREGANGKDGTDGTKVNLGIGLIASAIGADKRPTAYAWGPALQLQIRLARTHELSLEGSWAPGKDRATVLHAGYARYVLPWLGLTTGIYGEWIGLIGNEAKGQLIGALTGGVIRLQKGHLSGRLEVSAFLGANGFDSKRSFAYGVITTVMASWEF